MFAPQDVLPQHQQQCLGVAVVLLCLRPLVGSDDTARVWTSVSATTATAPLLQSYQSRGASTEHFGMTADVPRNHGYVSQPLNPPTVVRSSESAHLGEAHVPRGWEAAAATGEKSVRCGSVGSAPYQARKQDVLRGSSVTPRHSRHCSESSIKTDFTAANN